MSSFRRYFDIDVILKKLATLAPKIPAILNIQKTTYLTQYSMVQYHDHHDNATQNVNGFDSF